MAKYYSRLKSIENKKRTRQAALMLLATAAIIATSLFAGFKVLSAIFLFITSLNLSNQPLIKEDNIPPSPPRISIPYEATNSAQIKISGWAEPGATVYVTLNSESVGDVVTDENGVFMLAAVKLLQGANIFATVAIDDSGNKSQPSTPETVYYLSTPPKLTITAPEKDKSVTGGDRRLEIKGETDPGVRIQINSRVVIVAQSGSFSYQMSLEPGENTIEITASDRAGNQSREELKVNYSPS